MSTQTDKGQQVDLAIDGMTCAACATRIERVLQKSLGLTATVNYATGRARVDSIPASLESSALVSAIERAGYGAAVLPPPSTRHDAALTASGASRSARVTADRNRVLVAALLTAPFLLDMIAMAFGWHQLHLPGWAQLALATPVQLILGFPFHRRAVAAIRGGSPNMDVLISLGTNVAYVASVVALVNQSLAPLYFESSATIITLVLLGKLLEGRAVHKSASAVESLLHMQPRSALVDRNGTLAETNIESLKPGDIFVLRAGEVVPADGIVVSGETSLDESLVNGESSLVAKIPGECVWTASRNGDGTIRCRVTAVGEQTRLASIARLVDQAQSSRAPIQALADRISAWFVPTILILAVVTFGVNTWFLTSFSEAMTRAVAVLVVACPCALGLATPTAVMVGMGRAARSGIMLTRAEALQTAATIRLVFVDKTGTLTRGRPALAAISSAPGITQDDILARAGALEAGSEHPLARAVHDAAAQRGVRPHLASNFRAMPGAGVAAQIDGVQHELLSLNKVLFDKTLDLSRLGAFGQATTSVLLSHGSDGRKVLGALMFADELRASAPTTVERLARMGVSVCILSGDRHSAVQAVADSLNIGQFHAELSPEEKLEIVALAKARGGTVAMVGDGVNDAPALAAASVGIAIGSGTQIAHESADVTLIGDDIGGVADMIELSRATMAVIRQNLFFAFIYNVGCIPLAMAGYLHPMLASGAMAMSSLCVVANALRLASVRFSRRAPASLASRPLALATR